MGRYQARELSRHQGETAHMMTLETDPPLCLKILIIKVLAHFKFFSHFQPPEGTVVASKSTWSLTSCSLVYMSRDTVFLSHVKQTGHLSISMRAALLLAFFQETICLGPLHYLGDCLAVFIYMVATKCT